MPLDGHAYLVAQGWSGKGTGLRQGAIARPIPVTQKKTLSGVGKDRDEAFPFWDHVFEAAAINIQVKLHKDDDESQNEDSLEPSVQLQRTTTGIISNRRPKTGTPATSATTTSDPQASSSVRPRLSVIAAAKQEAARRMLYASFFRGPVLGPEDGGDKIIKTTLVTEGGLSTDNHDSDPPLRSVKAERKKRGKEKGRCEEKSEAKRQKRGEKMVTETAEEQRPQHDTEPEYDAKLAEDVKIRRREEKRSKNAKTVAKQDKEVSPGADREDSTDRMERHKRKAEKRARKAQRATEQDREARQAADPNYESSESDETDRKRRKEERRARKAERGKSKDNTKTARPSGIEEPSTEDHTGRSSTECVGHKRKTADDAAVREGSRMKRRKDSS